MARPPQAPPELAGYSYETVLGSGGFADVFLYRQQRPQRRVAIKVLLSTVLDESVARQFEGEANVMASLSTHPSIVAIYAAEVSADHRPYIVMEYCSRPNYGVRFRRERITVAEALRVGVQIAGAVETAHRAGILHRDIKPANILVTDYNRPALTDFGISIATTGGQDIEDSQGLSIPWSPPEFFTDPPRADVRSDVFSLAATIYSLLASATPFERRGQRNSATDLIQRISTEPLLPLDRPDVPPELGRVLAVAMAKDPQARYPSALDLGRALQQVELGLSLPVTQMDVLDERGPAPEEQGQDDELEAHTRIRRVSTVDSEESSRRLDRFAGVAPALSGPRHGSPGSGTSAHSAASAAEPGGESTVLRPAGAAPLGATRLAATAAGGAAPERTTRTWPWIVLAAVLVVLLGVGTTIGVRALVVEPEPVTATSPVNVPTGGAEAPGEPVDPKVVVITEESEGVTGRAKVTWGVPEGYTEDDFFRVRWKDMPDNYEKFGEWTEQHGRSSEVRDMPPNLKDRCLEVQTVSPDGQSSGIVEACLEDDG